MNINFTMTVHTFEEAAILEKALKANNLRYKTNVEDKPGLGAGKSLRRTRVTKAEVVAVLACSDAHPGWTDNAISKSCNVGRASVGRIKRGTHALQQENGAL